MQYNGIELIEMTPENWDGKTRKMLVWLGTDSKPVKCTIVGYELDDDGYALWIEDDAGLICRWTHCAEIPEELEKSFKELEKSFKELKEENNELRAKLEAFGELHKVVEFLQKTNLDNKPKKEIS